MSRGHSTEAGGLSSSSQSLPNRRLRSVIPGAWTGLLCLWASVYLSLKWGNQHPLLSVAETGFQGLVEQCGFRARLREWPWPPTHTGCLLLAVVGPKTAGAPGRGRMLEAGNREEAGLRHRGAPAREKPPAQV